jgi:hypothetical protein
MFAVIWTPSANGDLAVIAFSHADRLVEIEDAGDEIDDKLQSDPTGNGRHISEGIWRIEAHPIAVIYSIEGVEVTVHGALWIG